MIVILEGPDGGGKTTLANKFIDRGFRYLHNGLYSDLTSAQLAEVYMRQLTDALLEEMHMTHETSAGDYRGVVIDRSFISEIIYGMIMRGSSRFTARQVHAFSEICQLLGVRQILCLPPWPIVLENWRQKRLCKFDEAKRTGDYVDATHKIKQIYDAYAESVLHTATYCHVQVYDYTIKSQSEVLLEKF